MGYEILEHTADAKFKAYGDSLDEAFSESVKALSEIVGGLNGQTYHKIDIKSESHESLLFDFMDKLIFLQDVNDVAVSHAEDLQIDELEDEYHLTAKVWVDSIEPSMNVLDIKAPTYSDMEIDYDEGQWSVQIVLDI